jgi:hypothetical protein
MNERVRNVRVQDFMTTLDLAPCPRCGLSGEQLHVTKHMAWLEGTLVTTYYVNCACPDPRMFATEEAARDGWQREATAPKHSHR